MHVCISANFVPLDNKRLFNKGAKCTLEMCILKKDTWESARKLDLTFESKKTTFRLITAPKFNRSACSMPSS